MNKKDITVFDNKSGLNQLAQLEFNKLNLAERVKDECLKQTYTSFDPFQIHQAIKNIDLHKIINEKD
ncbi:MAG: hypothetical protein JWQ09_5878 [Segetibacter sp.]|nr:hypothetical protein [Segetibacter sp.]